MLCQPAAAVAADSQAANVQKRVMYDLLCYARLNITAVTCISQSVLLYGGALITHLGVGQFVD